MVITPTIKDIKTYLVKKALQLLIMDNFEKQFPPKECGFREGFKNISESFLHEMFLRLCIPFTDYSSCLDIHAPVFLMISKTLPPFEMKFNK